MVSLPAIEAVLQRHFGEADEGPVDRRRGHRPPEHPDIVLFTRRPADRAEVNALIREAGLSALHYVRQVIGGGRDPGARHRQDRLPRAEGPLLAPRTPDAPRVTARRSAAGPGARFEERRPGPRPRGGRARSARRHSRRKRSLRPSADHRPDAAAESRAERRRGRARRGGGPRGRSQARLGHLVAEPVLDGLLRPIDQHAEAARGRRRAARRPRPARSSGSRARTGRTASAGDRRRTPSSPDAAMAARMCVGGARRPRSPPLPGCAPPPARVAPDLQHPAAAPRRAVVGRERRRRSSRPARR